MPVRKVGKNCYQWGNQKVYCGVGAYQKASAQGNAIYLTGWREAEDEGLEIRDMTYEDRTRWPIDFYFLPNKDFDSELFLVNDRYFLFQRDSHWVIWDMERRTYEQWNYLGSPVRYFDLETTPAYDAFFTKQDALTLLEWEVEKDRERIEKLWREWENEDRKRYADALFLMTEGAVRGLRKRMNQEEKEMNKHPNRGYNWIPNRIKQEATAEIMADLPCKKCGERHFNSLAQADRHKHFCHKYGVQPENGFFFTPMALELIRLGILGDSLDNKNNNE